MGMNIFLTVVFLIIAALLTIAILRFFFGDQSDSASSSHEQAQADDQVQSGGQLSPTSQQSVTDVEPLNLLVTRVIVAAVLTIIMLIPIVINFTCDAAVPDWMVNPWLQAILITPVMFFSGYPIHTHGWIALRQRTPNRDSLASISTIAAYAYGLIIAVDGNAFPNNIRATYFEFVGVIITLVLLAQLVDRTWLPPHRPFPLQHKVDQFTNVFVPIVLIIGVWTFVLWLIFIPDSTALPKALSAAISVLIIACPCSLGWATPLAVSLALRAAHRDGMTIQSLDALQKASNIRSVTFSSTVASSCSEAMAELNKAGIRTAVIDFNSDVALAMARATMQDLSSTRNHTALVALVSDGSEPASAREAVDISIVRVDDPALLSSSATTFPGADVIALNCSHSRVLDLMTLSRKTMITIKENLIWTFIFNIISIPLAAGVFYPLWGWLLGPVAAAIAMILSSLAVLLNSQRLSRISFNRKRQ